MNQPSVTVLTEQLADMLRSFMLLKPRLESVLPMPENLTFLKDRLGELIPEGGVGHAAYYGIFFRIGLVLSSDREPITMGELSEMLAVPASTATRLVDWMVESEYIERLPDPEDRRIVRVALTATGRELYQTINQFVAQRIEQILRRFSPDERQAVVSSLQKVMTVLEEAAR